MTDILFSPIRLNELETLIQNSVRKALDESQSKKRDNQPDADELLTVQACAKFLNLSVPTIYGKISRNELPFMKKSKRVYFLKTDLIKFLKTGRVQTVSEIEAEASQYLKIKGGKKS